MKGKFLIGICICLLLLGILGSLWVFLAPQGTVIQIRRDGEVLYSFDLEKTENQTLELTYEERHNTVQIQDGKIRILEADCPDETCVRMGWLDSAAPIVCLPNHLVIEFAGNEEGADVIIR